MLWKPYCKGGTSKCFQPKWTSPWAIATFFHWKSQLSIENDNNEQMKNVHVNKLIKKLSRIARYDGLQPNAQ